MVRKRRRRSSASTREQDVGHQARMSNAALAEEMQGVSFDRKADILDALALGGDLLGDENNAELRGEEPDLLDGLFEEIDGQGVAAAAPPSGSGVPEAKGGDSAPRSADDGKAAGTPHELFAARLAEAGLTVSKPRKVWRKARRGNKRAWGPPFYTAVSEALAAAGVALDPSTAGPGPAFAAAVYVYQARSGRRKTGVADTDTVKLLTVGVTDEALRERLERITKPPGRRAGQTARESGKASQYARIQVKTPVLGVGFSGGVNPTMHARLSKAHTALMARLRDALAQAAASGDKVKSRIDGRDIEKADNEGLRHWLGIREKHLGFSYGHAKRSYHKTGSAVDINYHSNPWTAVRSGKRIGGEGGTSFGVNVKAVEAIDRAMAFMKAGNAEIHAELRPDGLSEDEKRKWAGEQWERFNKVSETVSDYCALVYDREAARKELIDNGPRKVLLNWYGSKLAGRSKKAAAKPLEKDDATARIQAVIDSKHGGRWSRTADQMGDQIREDLHLIARSMVRGTQKAKPGLTRNPLLGTFDLKKELVQELVAAGLRWGGCELGRNSGDMMHFDLGETPAFDKEKKRFDEARKGGDEE